RRCVRPRSRDRRALRRRRLDHPGAAIRLPAPDHDHARRAVVGADRVDALMGASRRTAVVSLPRSSPLYAAWRTRPSPVQPANSARMTISGRSRQAFLATARGGVGGYGVVFLE